MKRLLAVGILVLIFAVSANAQNTHTVSLAWTASSDAAANSSLTYNVYRLNGACPATAPAAISGSGFTKLNTTPITTTAYVDSGLAPGTYCYFASAFLNLTESNPSNDASGIVQPKAPTSFGVTAVAKLTTMIEVKVRNGR